MAAEMLESSSISPPMGLPKHKNSLFICRNQTIKPPVHCFPRSLQVNKILPGGFQRAPDYCAYGHPHSCQSFILHISDLIKCAKCCFLLMAAVWFKYFNQLHKHSFFSLLFSEQRRAPGLSPRIAKCQPWIRCTVQMKSNGVCRCREEKVEAGGTQRSRRGGLWRRGTEEKAQSGSALHPVSSTEEFLTLRGRDRGSSMSSGSVLIHRQPSMDLKQQESLQNCCFFLILKSSVWPQPLALGFTEVGQQLIRTDVASIID